MFGKYKKMRDEIVGLRYRVKELEERLCPCAQHQWLVTDTQYDVLDSSGYAETFYTYQCRRCGKIKRTYKLLPTIEEGDDHG